MCPFLFVPLVWHDYFDHTAVIQLVYYVAIFCVAISKDFAWAGSTQMHILPCKLPQLLLGSCLNKLITGSIKVIKEREIRKKVCVFRDFLVACSALIQ